MFVTCPRSGARSQSTVADVRILERDFGRMESHSLVIVRESGRPSTPRMRDDAPSCNHVTFRGYWVARSSRAMTTERLCVNSTGMRSGDDFLLIEKQEAGEGTARHSALIVNAWLVACAIEF